MNTVRQELNLPAAASFGYDVDGNVHILDTFNSAWCEDEEDPETGEWMSPEIENLAPLPDAVDDICQVCVTYASQRS